MTAPGRNAKRVPLTQWAVNSRLDEAGRSEIRLFVIHFLMPWHPEALEHFLFNGARRRGDPLVVQHEIAQRTLG